MELKTIKILEAVTKKTGTGEKGPWALIKIKAEFNGKEYEMTTFDTKVHNCIGKEVQGFVQPSTNEKYPGLTFRMPKGNSYGSSPKMTPETDALLLSKLNEILGILHANFPTAYSVQKEEEPPVEDELTF